MGGLRLFSRGKVEDFKNVLFAHLSHDHSFLYIIHGRSGSCTHSHRLLKDYYLFQRYDNTYSIPGESADQRELL